MITKKQKEEIIAKCLKYFKNAKIALTDEEKRNIEIADFGFGRINDFGIQLVTYINTERVCAKELLLFPGQICPEHRHPEINREPGKEEIFRCRWEKIYLYVPGEPVKNPKGKIPEDKKNYFTVWHEIILNPGEQYTLDADTLHWFQAGSKGAIVSEFSTRSRDEADIWTDPEIKRIPEIEE